MLYAHDRFEARPTLDIDFMATRINNDKENIKRIIKEICNVECAPNGASYWKISVKLSDKKYREKNPFALTCDLYT